MANPTITNVDNTGLILGLAQMTEKTILTGQELSAGAVLGAITATGKLQLCETGAGDGSEVAAYILPADIDTTGGDATAKVIKSGKVYQSKLSFGGTDTIADHDNELRDVSIITVADNVVGNYDNQ